MHNYQKFIAVFKYTMSASGTERTLMALEI
jgi:hypothetical protein